MNLRYQLFLSKAVTVCIYAVFALPLFVTKSTLFPYVFSKGIAFQILIEIAALGLLTLVVFGRGYRMHWRHPIFISVLASIAVLSISSIFGSDFYRSFWSTPERMTGIFYLIHVAALILILSSMVTSEKQWRHLFWWILSISFCVSAVGIFEKFANLSESHFRIASTLGNPFFLAHYLLLCCVFCVYLFFFEKKLFLRTLIIITCILHGIVIVFSGTRGVILSGIGFISLLLVACSFFILHRTIRRSLMRWFAVVLACIVLSGVVFFASSIKNNLSQSWLGRRITTDLFYDPDRLVLWNEAFRKFRERPLLGWGAEVSDRIFFKDSREYPEGTFSVLIIDRAHLYILDILLASGLVGFIVNIVLWTFVVRSFVLIYAKQKSFHDRNRALIPFFWVAAYIIPILTAFETPTTLSLFAFISGFSISTQELTISHRTIKNRGVGRIMLLPAAASIIFTVYLNSELFYVGTTAVRAYTHTGSDLLKAQQLFQNALSRPTFLDTAIRVAIGKGIQNAIAHGKIHENDPLFQNYFRFAIQEIRHGLSKDGTNFTLLSMAGNLYSIAADNETRTDGIELLESTLKHTPSRSIFYHQLAILYLKNGDLENARLREFRALELFPDGLIYHLGMARIYLQLGNIDGFIEEIKKTRTTIEVFDDPTIYRTFAEKMPCRARQDAIYAIVTEGIKMAPQNLDYRISKILIGLNSDIDIRGDYYYVKKIDSSAGAIIDDAISAHPCALTIPLGE